MKTSKEPYLWSKAQYYSFQSPRVLHYCYQKSKAGGHGQMTPDSPSPYPQEEIFNDFWI